MLQVGHGLSPRRVGPPTRSLVATVAVALVHIALVWMLMVVHEADYRPHRQRPFQVRVLPYEFASPHARERSSSAQNSAPKSRRPRERSTAIVYPPVPEPALAPSSIEGLRITPDCGSAVLAQSSPEQRARCAYVPGRVAGEADFLDPKLRARFAAEQRQNAPLVNGPFHTCPPGSRRALMGLSCWKGLDN